MKSRVAVVSGSNKGIGFAIVSSLCKKFDGIVYLTSRNETLGKKAIGKLNSENLYPKYFQLDITDLQSIIKLKDYMLNNHGGIDVLINNAGIAYAGASTVPFFEQANTSLKTNVFGTLNMSKILLPIIKPNGRVVNISSFMCARGLNECNGKLQTEFRSDTITEENLVKRMKEFLEFAKEGKHKENGFPHTALGASKVAITVMSRIHARWLREEGKNNILLNCCCPGLIRTEMSDPALNSTKTPHEGAITPVYLALLPKDATEPHGEYVVDKIVQLW